jgi:hypothetical protein
MPVNSRRKGANRPWSVEKSKRGKSRAVDQSPLDGEEWRDAPGWEGVYEVSNLGRIRRSVLAKPGKGSVPGMILSLSGRIDTNGYQITQFYRNQKRTTVKVHSLVAGAFLGPRPPWIQVNHKNGVKTDNRLENLEYVTGVENVRHAVRTGLVDPKKLSAAQRKACRARAKLTAENVREIRRRAAEGETRVSLATEFGIHRMTVGEIVRGEIWQGV